MKGERTQSRLWTRSYKSTTMIKVMNQSKSMIKIATNGRLGALKEDKHDQDHNNKVAPTFDDNH